MSITRNSRTAPWDYNRRFIIVPQLVHVCPECGGYWSAWGCIDCGGMDYVDILETHLDAVRELILDATVDAELTAIEETLARYYAGEQAAANAAHTRVLLACWAAEARDAEAGTRAAVSGGEAAEF